MSCPDRETLSAFVDGAVEAPVLAEIERHLSGCAPCSEFVLEMRRLTAHGRASLQAISVPARAEPALLHSAPQRAGLLCALSLAAASVLLATVSVLLAMHPRNALQLQPVTVSTKRPSQEKFVMPSDADFEAWAAPYRRMHIPLVPMEEVGTYRSSEAHPQFHEFASPRNHS